MLDENYPFSKYSMYSNPSSRPLRYHYLVDAAGDPIPTKFHTRLTPSKITKTLRRTKSQVREEMGILEDKAEADALSRVESLAAEKVVARLWRESQKLPRKRHLPEGFGLIEVTICYRDKVFVEEEKPLANYRP